MLPFGFPDDVVLVTGAAAGIGLGIAQAFHDAGARVAIADVRDAALERAASRLGAGARVFAQVMEVLALRYDFLGVSMTLHNFANRPAGSRQFLAARRPPHP
ncbi:MAG: SDR family NAD(P)-dependent oxidoreductase [Candidatus Rokuibacteriota bacterium]